jgi:hypothetical protein
MVVKGWQCFLNFPEVTNLLLAKVASCLQNHLGKTTLELPPLRDFAGS